MGGRSGRDRSNACNRCQAQWSIISQWPINRVPIIIIIFSHPETKDAGEGEGRIDLGRSLLAGIERSSRTPHQVLGEPLRDQESRRDSSFVVLNFRCRRR